MKKLTLKEIDSYIKIVNKISSLTAFDNWAEAERDTSLIKAKASYIITVKLLKEICVLTESYEYKLPQFSRKMIKEECITDNIYEIGEMLSDLQDLVYRKCHWTINQYPLMSFYDYICESMGIALDDIIDCCVDEISHYNFPKNISEQDLRKFLNEDFDLFQSLVRECSSEIVNHNFTTSELIVLRNRKLGNYLSFQKTHPEISNSAVANRINELLDIDICPVQIHIPHVNVRNKLMSNDFITSYTYFQAMEQVECVDNYHIQLDRVLYIVLLDSLLDLAYEEFSIDEVAA